MAKLTHYDCFTEEENSTFEAKKWLHTSVKICDDDLLKYLEALKRQIERAKGTDRDYAKVLTHIRDSTLLAMKLRTAKYG